jgi:hypothetical protein
LEKNPTTNKYTFYGRLLSLPELKKTGLVNSPDDDEDETSCHMDFAGSRFHQKGPGYQNLGRTKKTLVKMATVRQ